jgi:hypothetical protein
MWMVSWMCNRHRIVTARDQYEMLSPWRTAYVADQRHPDLLHTLQIHGSVHTTGGRVLPHRTAIAFGDAAGWQPSASFTPSQHAMAGASAYSSMMGLQDPHAGHINYQGAIRTPQSVKAVGQHYDSLPNMDKSAVPSFNAMRDEVSKQHDFMTNRLGIKTQTVDHDPYPDVHHMVADVNNNKTLKVMGTGVTGAHPFFSDEDNDKFRAVHDFFGHAATGRSFDRHGEQAAYLAHAQMFSPHALGALSSETAGQNSSLILNGHFGPQKIATMHPDMIRGLGSHQASRTAVVNLGPEFQDSAMKDIDETGGFSRRGPQKAPPKGFMVAQPGTEHVEPSPGYSGESISEYGKQHLPAMEADPDLYQGGWDDKESGDFYHDMSRHHDDIFDAAEAGYGDNDDDAQHGIYDLGTGTTFSPLELHNKWGPGYMMAGRDD